MTTPASEFGPEESSLLTLAGLHCEGVLTDAQSAELNALLRSSPVCRQLFVEYLQLHGHLHWSAPGLSAEATTSPGKTATVRVPVKAESTRTARSRRSRWTIAASVAAITLFAGTALWRQWNGSDEQVLVTNAGSNPRPAVSVERDDNATTANASGMSESESLPPLPLDQLTASRESTAVDQPGNDLPVVEIADSPAVPSTTIPSMAVALSDDAVIADIDRLLATAWSDNGVQPAEPARDEEWLRRTSLTFLGRIPTAAEISSFESLSGDSTERRREAVRTLVSSRETAENLAVIWSNLLIGRSNPRDVNAEALQAWLQRQFAENRPWMDTVGELVAAEGRSDRNGATNFLLAHLNDQATPATAVMARLFLGRQVQCTQCHDHPFAKERTQDEFWSLNAFFKQTERKAVVEQDPSGSPRTVLALVDRDGGGMTFYESRRGQQKAVLPEFNGQVVDDPETGSRRSELARLLADDSQHQVARAMVNRIWAHVFGHGFTSPVDDLGLHNPASHPELLDRLTQAFVDSGYDIRRLLTWITSTRAYQLSGRAEEATWVADDPQEGGVPLFARAYARPLSPEQVYESIRTAIRSMSGESLESSVGTAHRRQWIDQFVRSFGTDENDEQLSFEGNIAQALMMMNGRDLQEALPGAAAGVVHPPRGGSRSASESLQQVSLATLGRQPTEAEVRVFRARLRALGPGDNPDLALRTAIEDMLWAYFNSSEFLTLQ
jgi:hypothetical protein